MRRALTVVWIVTLFAWAGRVHALPAAAVGKEPSPADEKKVATDKAAPDKMTAARPAVKNLRCPEKEPWTDEVVARSIKVPVERLRALKAARSLGNDQICTASDKMLARAFAKLDRPKADKPEQWAEFYKLQRLSEDGKVKPDGLIKGHEHRKKVLARIAEKARLRTTTTAAQPGEAAPEADQTTSPTNDVPLAGVDTALAGIASNQWTAIGPGNVGGRIRAIAINPTNTDNIWVGGVAGGIWHSTDRGASFSPVNDFLPSLAISSIVIDPTNPATMYAGTGEGFFNADAVRGYGVFKSVDGGTTWNQLSSTTPSTNTGSLSYGWYYVNRLAISRDGATLLAATRAYASNWGSIWRSTDGGVTWSEPYSSGRVTDVRFDPNDAAKAIASVITYNFTTSQWESSIIRSTNGGQTWATQKTFTNNDARIELAYAASNSQVVYASRDNSSGEVWRSTDGGATWTLMSTPQHLGNQGWYDNTIWVDPTDATHVVAAGLDMWRSTNSGVTWTKISNWLNNMYYGYPNVPHADHHALVADPGYNGAANRTLYNANDGGFFRAADLTLATQTSGWESLNHNLAVTQFYSVAGHTAAGTRIIGGAQDNGMQMNAGPGTNWSMFNGGDGGYSAVDATNDNYLYGEYVYLQICRSSNRGATTTYIDKTGTSQLTDSRSGATANFIAPFILDPNDSNRMLAGGASLWLNNAVKSGTSWTAVKPATGSLISAIAVAAGNSAIIWVGHNNGAVYRTANGLDATPTWTLVSSTPARMVMRILIDKDNPNTVYVSFGGYNSDNLYKTTDNGSTWTNLNQGGVLPAVPCFALARHPANANWLYAGTEVGLFTTENGGATWSASNDGPANVPIVELAWRDSTTLLAATHGRGMFTATAIYQAPSATAVTADHNPSVYGQTLTLTAAVTPASATGTITFMDGATTLGSATLSGGSATFAASGLSVGSHIITAVYGGDSANLGSTSPTLTQAVTPASLTVTAAAKSKIYGALDPALTYSVTGFVNGDTVAIMTGSLARVAGEAMGTYAIQQGTLSAGANYTITYVGANLTISAAPLVRLVIAGQPDTQYASLADAVSAVPAGGTTSFLLVAGDITQDLNYATDAALNLVGGYSSDLTQKVDGAVTTIHGSLALANGTANVESLALMP